MEMSLTVVHTGRGHAMECETPQGVKMTFDSTDQDPHGASPMQHVLAAIGACSLLDVEVILRKKRLEFSNLRVECVAHRPDDVTPKPFLGVKLVFRVDGAVPPKALDDAVRLAVDRYCSVGDTIRKGAPITYETYVG